jgi:hypothetical protein
VALGEKPLILSLLKRSADLRSHGLRIRTERREMDPFAFNGAVFAT